tara:strand:+ start:311 stop:526 length:216 start_codon:yes stop_codon:yes gene_type:complete
MKKIKKGDLVYVPSSVRLIRKDIKGAPTDYVILKKPASLLVVDIADNAYEVIYDKEKWLVEKRKTYGVSYD